MHERLSLILQKRREDASVLKKERRSIMRKKSKIEKTYIKMNEMKRIEVQLASKAGMERAERSRKRKIEETLR